MAQISFQILCEKEKWQPLCAVHWCKKTKKKRKDMVEPKGEVLTLHMVGE